MAPTSAPPPLAVRPANEASWEEIRAVFRSRGEAAKCQCQRCKLPHRDWWFMPVPERAARLRAETRCGDPGARHTSGLVAWLDGEPVGWCAVEPRTAYLRLMKMRVVWSGRDEDRNDPTVWAVPCFVTRAGFRRRGVSRFLAQAAIDHARSRGARALEGYPMRVRPGEDIAWGELNVGSHSIFAAAGFAEVGKPLLRRVTMRIDF